MTQTSVRRSVSDEAGSREAKKDGRVSRIARRDRRLVLVAALPAILLTGLFIIYPLIETVRISFADWRGIGPLEVVGWEHYATLLSDRTFWTAAGNSVQYSLAVTVGSVLFGLLIAIAIDRRIHLARGYRFLFFIPQIVPTTVVGILWTSSLDPNFGAVNRLLASINPDWVVEFLSEPDLAMWAICFVGIWQATGYPMIIILAGLQNVPREIQEAATLDGVSPWQRAWHITIPLTKSVITTVILLQLIFSFKVFDLVQAMTGGGPGDSTEVLGTMIYKTAFLYQDFGYASAISVVSALLIAGIAMTYLIVFKPGRLEK